MSSLTSLLILSYISSLQVFGKKDYPNNDIMNSLELLNIDTDNSSSVYTETTAPMTIHNISNISSFNISLVNSSSVSESFPTYGMVLITIGSLALLAFGGLKYAKSHTFRLQRKIQKEDKAKQVEKTPNPVTEAVEKTPDGEVEVLSI